MGRNSRRKSVRLVHPAGAKPDTYLCITGFAHSYSGAGKIVPCTNRSAGRGYEDALVNDVDAAAAARDVIAGNGLSK